MPHAYVSNFVHCVFSTKERKPIIPADLQENLWAYMHGIARNHGVESVAIGGFADHAHLLVLVPPKIALSVAVQKIKANSSRWMGEHGCAFAWQEGYGAFSVGASQIPAVKDYIHTQSEHHKKHTFEEEFIALLVKYGIRFNRDEIFA